MQTTRNHALDMAKVFATFFILFHHYQMVGIMITGKTIDEVTFYSSTFQQGDFSWGYMVELFFLISGFCMWPYVQKIQQGLTFYRFYTRRAARILPLVAISGIVCAAVLLLYDKVYGGAFWGKDPSLFGVVLQALGIQSGWGFADPSLNGVTWYCSVLLLCYLLFYAIVYWSQRLGVSPYYGMVFMIFVGCAGQTYQTDWAFMDSTTTRGYAAFFAGIVFAVLLPPLQKWRGTFWVALAFLPVFAAAFYKKGGNLQYMPFLLTFVLYPALLVVLQHTPFTIVSRLPVWEGWARISYSVFIWHLVFYVLVYDVVKMVGVDPSALASLPMMLLCAAVLQPIGWLSYRFLEQPLNQKVSALCASLDPARKPEHV